MSSRERGQTMFKANDYVFYGMTGICRVDDVCERPFEGAPTGVLYYVLHTLTEPKQTIINPVSNDKVRIRPVMTASEADAFFSLLPTLSPLEGNSAKQLRDAYITSIKSGDPALWGRILRTYRTRLHLAEAKLARVTDAERNFYEQALRLLGAEIALALSISLAEAEGRLHIAAQ